MKEELTPEDFEEEVDVKISEKAFEADEPHCDTCGKKMEKVFLNIEIPNTSLIARLEAFKCKNCGKEYLNGTQADKLDRALSLSNAIEKRGIVYERAGNFDGTNVFVRFPAQMIKGNDIRAEIVPISATEYFVHFKKGKKN